MKKPNRKTEELKQRKEFARMLIRWFERDGKCDDKCPHKDEHCPCCCPWGKIIYELETFFMFTPKERKFKQ